jgi:hypothetical protein
MKMITYAMLALGLMAALPVEANAVVCARGPYRAGCAGPHGAVGVHRGYGYGYHGGARSSGAATAIMAGFASAGAKRDLQIAPAEERQALFRRRAHELGDMEK